MSNGRKMWSLECTHGFPNSRPCDLVFDLRWSLLYLSKISCRQTFWKPFLNTGLKSVVSFFLDLTKWSSFWALHNFTRYFPRQTFWPCFISTEKKGLLLKCTQNIFKTWCSDLDLDLTWSIFYPPEDIIKTNIPTIFYGVELKMWPSEPKKYWNWW